jgi:hypothetical protein
MRKIVVLAMAVGCVAYGAKKPEPVVILEMSYDAPTEKVFGAMVQAVSTFEIKTALKDGCLVKFSTVRPPTATESLGELFGAIGAAGGGGPQATVPISPVEWTILCTGRSDGKTLVTIRATIQVSGRAVDVMAFRGATPDKAFVQRTVPAIWSSIDATLSAQSLGVNK